MMKTVFVLALAAALAGCSQTAKDESGKPKAAAQPPVAEAAGKQASVTTDTAPRNDCDQAVQRQMNAAAVGGVLGMVGGFGFGSHGGAVAAHVATSTGSMIAHQQAEKQRAEIERNCY